MDIFEKISFQDYLKPNEYEPQQVKEHLDLLTESGIIVSTGTERSFFDAALCRNCTGLVVRDINPKVKAYVDFNTLLLKLSRDMKDYQELADCYGPTDAHEKDIDRLYNVVKKRLEVAEDFQPNLRKYYLNNLQDFAKIYYRNTGDWKGGEILRFFTKVRYFEIEEQFLRLQDLAKNDQIISTLGDISDLDFLTDKIIAVDTSNIVDYVFLDFKSKYKPRIIWTSGTGETGTRFYSYPFELLPSEKRVKFEALLGILKAAGTISLNRPVPPDLKRALFCPTGNTTTTDPYKSIPIGTYTQNILDQIEIYVDTNIYLFNSVGYLDFVNFYPSLAHRLNVLTDDQFQELLNEIPISLLHYIFQTWVTLKPARYSFVVNKYPDEFRKYPARNNINENFVKKFHGLFTIPSAPVSQPLGFKDANNGNKGSVANI